VSDQPTNTSGQFRGHQRAETLAISGQFRGRLWAVFHGRRQRTTLTLDDLAGVVNPVLRGWLAYFTVFYPSAVIPIGKRIDSHLVRWARWKYKRLRRSDKRAREWLKGVRQRAPGLFSHWALRY
jgi:Group II intron, maturase-specific domain